MGKPFLASCKQDGDNGGSDCELKNELEFAVIQVKGQSFMLHQIRKMIGMTIAVVRGHAEDSVIDDSWNTDRIDIPRAPGLGLMLDEVHYEKYNHRFGSDGIHEPLEWSKSGESVQRFKENFVHKDIRVTEAKSRSMLLWLRNLQIHKFEPRHFENIRPVVINRGKHLLPNETSQDDENLSINNIEKSENCKEPKAKVLKLVDASENKS